MRYFFSLTLLGLFSTFSAQSVISYPYNPDSDGDQFVSVSDVLSTISAYGSEFLPAEIEIDGVGLDEYLLLSNCLPSNFDSSQRFMFIDHLEQINNIAENYGYGPNWMDICSLGTLQFPSSIECFDSPDGQICFDGPPIYESWLAVDYVDYYMSLFNGYNVNFSSFCCLSTLFNSNFVSCGDLYFTEDKIEHSGNHNYILPQTDQDGSMLIIRGSAHSGSTYNISIPSSFSNVGWRLELFSSSVINVYYNPLSTEIIGSPWTFSSGIVNLIADYSL